MYIYVNESHMGSIVIAYTQSSGSTISHLHYKALVRGKDVISLLTFDHVRNIDKWAKYQMVTLFIDNNIMNIVIIDKYLKGKLQYYSKSGGISKTSSSLVNELQADRGGKCTSVYDICSLETLYLQYIIYIRIHTKLQ